MNSRKSKSQETFEDIEHNGLSLKPPTKRGDNLSLVALLVFVWYTAASFSISSSKVILSAFSFPLTLCTCQFILGGMIAATVRQCVPSSSHHHHHHHHHHQEAKQPEPPFLWIVLISFSYTLGFIFTNIAFSLVHVSFAETIKAAEPISSVLIGFIILNENNHWQTYASLIPICAGISISCKGEDKFQWLGFFFALLSNFCFSYRAVLSKHLLKIYSYQLDEITLFVYISFIGLTLLIPLWIYLESMQVVQLLMMQANIGFFVLPLYCFNGLAYATYNLMSILVLSRTDLVTHAVLNAFRRVFIIVTTSIYFRTKLSNLNILGVFIAIGGVVCFAIAKSRGPQPKN